MANRLGYPRFFSSRLVYLVLFVVLVTLVSLNWASASIHTLPFVKVVSVDPSSPQIFDTVSVTVDIERDINASINLLTVEYGDGATGQYGFNMTKPTIMVTIGHIYQTPGEYDLRVTVTAVDALNRTQKAQDVTTFTVDPRSTVLDFQVNPVHVNSSLHEYFTFQATLKTDQGVPLSGREISFWYSSTGNQTWYSVTVAKTDTNGQLILEWTPPFDGSYKFRANFTGDALYAPIGSTFNMTCFVTPEFQFPIAPLLCVLVCIPVLIRKQPRRG